MDPIDVLKPIQIPDSWECDIDRNLNKKYSERFLLGHSIVNHPQQIDEPIAFHEAIYALGFYFWTKGVDGHDLEVLKKRVSLIYQFVTPVKEKIFDYPDTESEVFDKIMNSACYKRMYGSPDGFKYANAAQNRANEAWARVTSEIWKLCENSPDKWSDFKLTRLATKKLANPQYLSHRRKNLLGFIEFIPFCFKQGYSDETIRGFLEIIPIEAFEIDSERFEVLKSIVSSQLNNDKDELSNDLDLFLPKE